MEDSSRVVSCVLSAWTVGSSTGKVVSTFHIRGSSLILMGLLPSSFEGFQSTYFRELVSICSRGSSLQVLCPG